MRKNASDGVDYSRVSVSTYIHMWVFGMVLVLLTYASILIRKYGKEGGGILRLGCCALCVVAWWRFLEK